MLKKLKSQLIIDVSESKRFKMKVTKHRDRIRKAEIPLLILHWLNERSSTMSAGSQQH